MEVPGKTGTSYALRFRAYGKRRYLTLGGEPEWTRDRAERELAYVLAQIERGTWQAAEHVQQPEVREDPTFHVFASEWFARHESEWRPKTARAYREELSLHLLPHFARLRLSEITVAEVDRYRSEKAGEWRRWEALPPERRQGKPRVIGPTTINKTLTRLGQILEEAVEYGHLDRNPARGKRRRLKASTPPRGYLDQAEHFEALLQAAGVLDARAAAGRQHVGRRPMLATLMFAGLRLGELIELRWRDVDLPAGRIRVGERDGGRGEAKTTAGFRTVDMLPALRDELLAWKARAPRTGPADRVFATATGGTASRDNIRNRVLLPGIALADERLEADGRGSLPPRLTPHGLRHSFASLLVALGEDPRYVMAQLGHTDPTFTLRLYSHSMRRQEGDLDRLRALVGHPERAETGRNRAQRHAAEPGVDWASLPSAAL